MRRPVAATLAVLLLSAVALAAPRPSPRAACCAAMSADTPSCCGMSEDASSGPEDTEGCCRMSAPEEAAPSLTSPAAPSLSSPIATSLELPAAILPGSLEAHPRHVSPRARPAPLHLLYSVFLV